MHKQPDLIPAREAQRMLGVSTKKMAAMLKEGTIPFVKPMLDRRKKLVSRAVVERLLSELTSEAA